MYIYDLVLSSLELPAYAFRALERCGHAVGGGSLCFPVTSSGTSGAAIACAGEPYQVEAPYQVGANAWLHPPYIVFLNRRLPVGRSTPMYLCICPSLTRRRTDSARPLSSLPVYFSRVFPSLPVCPLSSLPVCLSRVFPTLPVYLSRVFPRFFFSSPTGPVRLFSLPFPLLLETPGSARY